MKFRTSIEIERAPFNIAPCERMLFVGSCFAENMGRRFEADRFRVTANPFGVMYNPASILHTVERCTDLAPRVAVLTLGTNRVYVERLSGRIVDNCEKRPQRLFREETMNVEECTDYLQKVIALLQEAYREVKVVVTVSPVRYAKYGFHGSMLSKATLLLAADKLATSHPETVVYFPAYELMNDELRDYRFYQPDMIHPSEQAVEYIYERFMETFLSSEAKQFIAAWRPIKEALGHRPFHPESDEYRIFMEQTRQKAQALAAQYGCELPEILHP